MPLSFRHLWNRARSFLPVQGYLFDRPLVLLQSDDWGRVGLRDHEGLNELTAAGLKIGERPYDFYTLETAEDLAAVSRMLKSHRDSSGRPACLGMNFITANVDFSAMENAGTIVMRPLADGLPSGWHRPGLLEAYRSGIEAGVFFPALHGTTHFSRSAVERALQKIDERSALLRTLWRAGTPYIYWRMPWIGYEYWDPEQPENDSFLSLNDQLKAIGSAVGAFAKLFSSVPKSACAPGYRANNDTQRAWAQHGVRVSQNGLGAFAPPHFAEGEVLQIFRTVEIEPAVHSKSPIADWLHTADRCIARGMPVIVSVHSINFHSTVKDFRSTTLSVLDEFLSALERKYKNLLYLHDEDLWHIVQTGTYPSEGRQVMINVTKRRVRRQGLSSKSEGAG